MEPDNIDWDNIDSTFALDDTYENFDAPMWVDLSAFDDSLVDDEAWFCTRGEALYEGVCGISFLAFSFPLAQLFLFHSQIASIPKPLKIFLNAVPRWHPQFLFLVFYWIVQ